jgi:hypothetical protein
MPGVSPKQPSESVAGFQGGPGGDPSGGAAGLQYQHFTTDTNAHGFLGGTLGRGIQSVPSPGSFFSNPPAAGRNLSGGQFGTGHAHAVLDPEDSEED